MLPILIYNHTKYNMIFFEFLNDLVIIKSEKSATDVVFQHIYLISLRGWPEYPMIFRFINHVCKIIVLLIFRNEILQGTRYKSKSEIYIKLNEDK